MEIVIPTRSSMDFDFSSARTTPYSTAPSSPRRFGHDLCFSAPTSPGRASEIYREFQSELAMIPFDWEEKPGTPKSPKPKQPKTDDSNDFAFEFSVDLEKSSRSADELFDGGKIKPLKPPPGHVRNQTLSVSSPRSPKSPKKIIQNVFSTKTKKSEEVRGRERFQDSSNGSSRRSSRSLSPYRVSQFPWEEEKQVNAKSQPETNPKTLSSPTCSASKIGKKWSFKEFFLFRSASEGRASDKDPLKKYSSLFRKHEDVKNSSFRSTDSSNSGSVSKRRGPVSAHELHYTKNRAASEDMRKRTFLPYKQGILGRIGFNPLSSGFGTL